MSPSCSSRHERGYVPATCSPLILRIGFVQTPQTDRMTSFLPQKPGPELAPCCFPSPLIEVSFKSHYTCVLAEQVLFALLERVPSTRKASLSGYHRFRIKDHVFPAIRPREGGSVEGLLMTGLDAREKVKASQRLERVLQYNEVQVPHVRDTYRTLFRVELQKDPTAALGHRVLNGSRNGTSRVQDDRKRNRAYFSLRRLLYHSLADFPPSRCVLYHDYLPLWPQQCRFTPNGSTTRGATKCM